MVRALTATMLKVGRGKTSIDEFRAIIEAKDCTKASFAVPAHGLFLIQVGYPKESNQLEIGRTGAISSSNSYHLLSRLSASSPAQSIPTKLHRAFRFHPAATHL